MKRAVILLSGGLDSAVALWLAKSEGYELYTLSFDYGQRHNKEIMAAAKIAELAGVKSHRLVTINMDQWGGSSLTDKSMEVEDGDVDRTDIPVTYVPARNMVFLSIAASFAEAVEAQNIFIGVSQVDYSGYVDCRETFISAMENAINQGTVMAPNITNPSRCTRPLFIKQRPKKFLWALN
jgi:7-cyano-7-deazaguanine synthase